MIQHIVGIYIRVKYWGLCPPPLNIGGLPPLQPPFLHYVFMILCTSKRFWDWPAIPLSRMGGHNGWGMSIVSCKVTLIFVLAGVYHTLSIIFNLVQF